MTAPAVLRRWPAPGSVVAAAVREQTVRLRRAVPWAALLVTALVGHVAVMPHLAVRGVAPDGLLVAVVAVGAGRGSRAGAAFGFAAGLGADLFLSTPLGTSALACTVVGHTSGRSRPPRPSGAAGALCSPTSTCFACRTGRRHRRRRVDARRATARRSVVLTVAGVSAGQLGVRAVATGFGGVPFADLAGLLGMAGVTAVSAPLGPPIFAAVRRLAPPAGSRP